MTDWTRDVVRPEGKQLLTLKAPSHLTLIQQQKEMRQARALTSLVTQEGARTTNKEKRRLDVIEDGRNWKNVGWAPKVPLI